MMRRWNLPFDDETPSAEIVRYQMENHSRFHLEGGEPHYDIEISVLWKNLGKDEVTNFLVRYKEYEWILEMKRRNTGETLTPMPMRFFVENHLLGDLKCDVGLEADYLWQRSYFHELCSIPEKALEFSPIDYSEDEVNDYYSDKFLHQLIRLRGCDRNGFSLFRSRSARYEVDHIPAVAYHFVIVYAIEPLALREAILASMVGKWFSMTRREFLPMVETKVREFQDNVYELSQNQIDNAEKLLPWRAAARAHAAERARTAKATKEEEEKHNVPENLDSESDSDYSGSSKWDSEAFWEWYMESDSDEEVKEKPQDSQIPLQQHPAAAANEAAQREIQQRLEMQQQLQVRQIQIETMRLQLEKTRQDLLTRGQQIWKRFEAKKRMEEQQQLEAQKQLEARRRLVEQQQLEAQQHLKAQQRQLAARKQLEAQQQLEDQQRQLAAQKQLEAYRQLEEQLRREAQRRLEVQQRQLASQKQLEVCHLPAAQQGLETQQRLEAQQRTREQHALAAQHAAPTQLAEEEQRAATAVQLPAEEQRAAAMRSAVATLSKAEAQRSAEEQWATVPPLVTEQHVSTAATHAEAATAAENERHTAVQGTKREKHELSDTLETTAVAHSPMEQEPVRDSNNADNDTLYYIIVALVILYLKLHSLSLIVLRLVVACKECIAGVFPVLMRNVQVLYQWDTNGIAEFAELAITGCPRWLDRWGRDGCHGGPWFKGPVEGYQSKFNWWKTAMLSSNFILAESTTCVAGPAERQRERTQDGMLFGSPGPPPQNVAAGAA
jgi:hypothetical protein